MNSRERVLEALACRQPDRVPFCEMLVDRALARQLLGWSESGDQQANLEVNPYTPEEAVAVADHLGLDNLAYVLRAPVYATKVAGQDGRLFYGEGWIRSAADLQRVALPDPTDERLYEGARQYIAHKGDRALFFVTRIGIFPTMLSLGMERFAIALYEDRALIEELLDIYCDWAEAVAAHVCDMGFDVFMSTDDMAFNSAPFFSPRIFRELVLPRYRRVAQRISLPWVIHSDGNVLPFVDDLVDLGIAGLHPLEKGAMDIAEMKRRYGHRLCLLGNVDLNLLGAATPERVAQEVRDLIATAGPGGGYILTSGNSLAGYLIPENVTALARAVRAYGAYPLASDNAGQPDSSRSLM
jgi:hypothetical protein